MLVGRNSFDLTFWSYVRYYVRMNINMKNIISTTEARKNLFSIVDAVASPNIFYTLTDRGRAKAVIMSADEFESWAETLDLVSIVPNLKNEIRESEKEIKAGKFSTLEQFRSRYESKKSKTKSKTK